MNIDYQIKKLVRSECACYSPSQDGIVYTKNKPQSVTIKDYCDKEQEEDCICSLFKNKRCGYFEKSVLPMNPQLEALYQSKKAGYELPKEDKENISSTRGKVNVYCKRCGKTFQADNHRQQYCKFCKRIIQREKRYLKI